MIICKRCGIELESKEDFSIILHHKKKGLKHSFACKYCAQIFNARNKVDFDCTVMQFWAYKASILKTKLIIMENEKYEKDHPEEFKSRHELQLEYLKKKGIKLQV